MESPVVIQSSDDSDGTTVDESHCDTRAARPMKQQEAKQQEGQQEEQQQEQHATADSDASAEGAPVVSPSLSGSPTTDTSQHSFMKRRKYLRRRNRSHSRNSNGSDSADSSSNRVMDAPRHGRSVRRRMMPQAAAAAAATRGAYADISDGSLSDGEGGMSPLDEAHDAGHGEGVGGHAAGNSTGGRDPMMAHGGATAGSVAGAATDHEAPTAGTSTATSELASELRDVGKDVKGVTTLCVNAATKLQAVQSRMAALASKLSEQLASQAQQALRQRARIQQLEGKLQQAKARCTRLHKREAGWKAQIDELQRRNASLLQKRTHRYRHRLSQRSALSPATAAAVSPAAAAAAAAVGVSPMLSDHNGNAEHGGSGVARNPFQLSPGMAMTSPLPALLCAASAHRCPVDCLVNQLHLVAPRHYQVQ